MPNGTTFMTTQGNSSSPVPVQIITSSGEVVSQLLQSPGHSGNQQHQQIQIHQQPQTTTAQQIQQANQQTVQQVQIKQQPVPQQAVQIQPIVTTSEQPIHHVVQVTSQKAKTHFCQHCGKSFVAKHGLMLHNKRHPDGSCTLRSHICEDCGKAFLQKNHLILHQRQHLEQNRNKGQNASNVGQQQVIIVVRFFSVLCAFNTLALRLLILRNLDGRVVGVLYFLCVSLTSRNL